MVDSTGIVVWERNFQAKRVSHLGARTVPDADTASVHRIQAQRPMPKAPYRLPRIQGCVGRGVTYVRDAPALSGECPFVENLKHLRFDKSPAMLSTSIQLRAHPCVHTRIQHQCRVTQRRGIPEWQLTIWYARPSHQACQRTRHHGRQIVVRIAHNE